MEASLAADPDNRDGYLFLLDLLRGQTAGKPKLQGVLQDMADRFPDDPAPWLELATLHYSRNAYRKAESALEEARQRAPHDDRLLDLQAVGFLKSADQSRRKGRFALAARDLQRAEDLGRKVLGPVLPAKRLLLEIVSGGQDAAATVAPHLQRLPPGAQLRTLALLIQDLHDNSHISNVRPEMGAAVRGLLADKAALAGECSPDEIARLLDPLPAELDILYDDRRLAPIFVSWWPALLKRLDADLLPPVLDILMECGGRTQVRAEIERRLRGVRKLRRDPLLAFHLAVLRYEDGSDHHSRRFMDIVNGADAATRERLRAAAARLARHTQGLLRQALLTFEFEPLDMPPIAFGGGLPPIEEILSMLAEDLGIGISRREPAGPTPADRPDPGDPLLGERLRRAKMDDSADAPLDAARLHRVRSAPAPRGLTALTPAPGPERPRKAVMRVPDELSRQIHPQADFYVVVRGDSMSSVGYRTGDIIAIKRTPDAAEGNVVMARIGTEITLKCFHRPADDRVELKPCSSNPEHRPIVIDERTEDWEIVGVVVGAMVGPPRQGLPGP